MIKKETKYILIIKDTFEFLTDCGWDVTKDVFQADLYDREEEATTEKNILENPELYAVIGVEVSYKITKVNI